MRATLLDRDGGAWRVRYFYAIPDLDALAPQTRHAFKWSARLASWLFMNGHMEARP